LKNIVDHVDQATTGEIVVRNPNLDFHQKVRLTWSIVSDAHLRDRVVDYRPV